MFQRVPIWKRLLHDRDEVRIVALNLIPVFGIVLLDWSVLVVLLLYWLEGWMIIGIGLLQMNMAFGAPDPDPGDEPVFAQASPAAQSMVLTLFFFVFYAIAMSVHSAFLLSFFDVDGLAGDEVTALGPALTAVKIVVVTSWPAALGLFVSHALDFKNNFLNGALRGDGILLNGLLAPLYACLPVARVFLMQVVVLGSGFLVLLFQLEAVALALFVLLKGGSDLWVHRTLRRWFGGEEGVVSSE